MKTKFLIFSLLLLVSCSNQTTNNYFASTSNSQSANSTENKEKDNSDQQNKNNNIDKAEELKIVKINIPEYLVDYKSIVDLPLTLNVEFEDGSSDNVEVVWEKPFVNFDNKNIQKIKGNLLYKGSPEVNVNVEFMKYEVKLPLTSNLLVENEYIGLYHTRNDEHEINNLLEYLTNEYFRIAKFFRYKQLPKIYGYILPSADETLNYMKTQMNYKGDEGWGAGISKSEFLMVSPLNPPVPSHKRGVYSVAAHELLHAMHMYQLYEDNLVDIEFAPTWFVEGLATYLTQFARLNPYHTQFIDKPNFNFSDLNDRDVYRLPYDPGALVVKFLISTYGEEKFINYVKSLDLFKTYGKNESELSNEFKIYHRELIDTNGYETMYFRSDFDFKNNFNETDYLHGDIIEEEKFLILSEYVGNKFNYDLEKYLAKSRIFGNFGSGLSSHDNYYRGYMIIETVNFGSHFRANRYGIQNPANGTVISKIHEGKRVVYIYLKPNDSISDLIPKLPFNLFYSDYNYIYE